MRQLAQPEGPVGAALTATFRLARTPALSGHGLFFVAHNVSNVINYAFLLVMSQALAPADFALFAALFGMIYLASALANTAQTSVAAAVAAAGPEHAGAIVGSAMRRLALLGLPLAAVTAAIARPAAAYLHSDDVTSVLITGAALWLFLLAAVGYGGLQGSGRFALLGSGLIVAALGRLVLGLAFLWLGFGVTGALLGVAVGLALSAVLVAAPFGGSLRNARSAASGPPTAVLAALLVSVAIAVPTSADVVLAQHYFAGQAAGSYATVSVLGKMVIFGPLAVSLIFFPMMVRRRAAGEPTWPLLRTGLLVTGALALALTAAVATLGAAAPDLILRGYSVSFAFLVTYLSAMLVFSLVVTLLYYNLANGTSRFAGGVVIVLAVELAVIALHHPDAFALALVLLVGNLALLALGFVVSSKQVDQPEPGMRWETAVAAGLEDRYADGTAG